MTADGTRAGTEWLFRLFGTETKEPAWWLELGTMEQLAGYLSATNGRYAGAMLRHLRDQGENPGGTGLLALARMRASRQGESVADALAGLSGDKALRLASAMAEHGRVYVNSAGGWNWGTGLGEPEACLRSKSLAWPDFTEADIRVSRFPGGRHWYAYVGQVQVRDGGKVKFNTRAEALERAKRYITTKGSDDTCTS